jgi:ubiquinol-cytochrome c reductase cytochrome c1 subunit
MVSSDPPDLEQLHPPHYEWSHLKFFTGYDTASLRRGFEVYRNVCASCHSLKYLHYRELVGRTHTEEQAKALANSVEVKDGPNDQGEYFMRKGKLFDPLPQPYPNDEYARYINNGALPPDLSVITQARHNGEDYVMSLLTGYRDPPAGVTIRPGQYYNPYMDGGVIAMPPPLNDEGLEYEDGTPATISQQAKDVTTFLAFCAEPEYDYRQQQGAGLMAALLMTVAAMGYHKRFRYSILKSRRISWL